MPQRSPSPVRPVPAIHPVAQQSARSETYLESLQILERLHRLLLDLVKDEFERLGRSDLNPVQALLIYNLGTAEVTAGELRSRGCIRARMSATISRSWSSWAMCITNARKWTAVRCGCA